MNFSLSIRGADNQADMGKELIKNLDIEEAKILFASLGEKPYRAEQLFNWLFERNVDSFDKMTNFSKDLRRSLDERFHLSALENIDRLVSKIDGTEKYLFRTHDGNLIETVLIKNDRSEDGRLTICVSSQAGCAMGCRFCETAKTGYRRSLEPAEILDQVSQVRRISGLKNNNVVFMGMGEPFMNYGNVMKSADIMNYSYGFHISVRKITISTCGIYDGIERFIDEKRMYNLALSLNDTEIEKRRVNMPVEKKYPVMEIIKLFSRKLPASRNRLTIEYVMRADNISADDAKRLKGMFRYGRIKLNLIPLNGGDYGLNPPTADAVENFIRELGIMDVPVSVRNSAGADICGACGQLSGRIYKTEALVS